MASMRAIFVLATILSLATPQMSWSSMALSREARSSWSLAAPGTGPQIVRAAASKTDKTFHAGFAIGADRPALYPPFVSRDCTLAVNTAPPHLDLNAPPLGARPPPIS
jgi:hypothetical protein